MYSTYPPSVQKIIRDRLAIATDLDREISVRKKKLTEDKRKRPEKITVAAQASNFGQIGEQILPAFVTFPYKQRECRILFKPIDYIVFTKLSEERRVESIKFVDVKTGGGRLGRRQRQIRDCIADGAIKHRVV
jgi:predicted Holliday junction resolvase-like endonuclease